MRLKSCYGDDESRVLRAPAELGSMSAITLVYLDLSCAALAQAFRILHDERAAQTNLAEILGATRYRVYGLEKLYCAKCS